VAPSYVDGGGERVGFGSKGGKKRRKKDVALSLGTRKKKVIRLPIRNSRPALSRARIRRNPIADEVNKGPSLDFHSISFDDSHPKQPPPERLSGRREVPSLVSTSGGGGWGGGGGGVR